MADLLANRVTDLDRRSGLAKGNTTNMQTVIPYDPGLRIMRITRLIMNGFASFNWMKFDCKKSLQVRLSNRIKKCFSRSLLALALYSMAHGAMLNAGELPPAQEITTRDGLNEVVVTGHGDSDENALKAAFVIALERTVGTIVHSETVSRNFQIESDAQTLLTNGCIESYDEISSGKSGGVVSKTIRARVRRGIVADWVKRAGWEAGGNLSDTWARLATTIRGRNQALAMIHEKAPQIRDRLYKTTLVDLSSGRDMHPREGVPQPFTEENLDGDVLCVWAAALKPDFEFWENHAAPLLAACLDVLCEKKARLFLNMNTAPLATGGNVSRAPWKRWQRIQSDVAPAWLNAKPVSAPAHAMECIALETRTTHPECLDLTLYFLTPEVYQRIMHPREILNAEGHVVARPESFSELRTGLRATIRFNDGSSKDFTVIQSSPLFQSMPLPWTGNVQATYCGPYFFENFFTDGWESKSDWPNWQGPVRPGNSTPGFAPFLVANNRILRADGVPAQHMRELISSQTNNFDQSVPDWLTDSEVLMPLVFKMKVDELRRVSGLSVQPITGAPPIQPGIAEKLIKFLKLLSK